MFILLENIPLNMYILLLKFYFVNNYNLKAITYSILKTYNNKMTNKTNTLKLFGKRLKELRTKNKVTQEKLAELADIEQQQICRIEKGACFTTFDTLEKISKALNIQIDELFNFSHQNETDALLSELYELLKKAPNEKIQLIYRIVNDILK